MDAVVVFLFCFYRVLSKELFRSSARRNGGREGGRTGRLGAGEEAVTRSNERTNRSGEQRRGREGVIGAAHDESEGGG